MGSSIIQNITITKPTAKRIFISSVDRSTVIVTRYSGAATIDNVSVQSAKNVNTEYRSFANVADVFVDAQLQLSIDTIDTQYSLSAILSNIQVESVVNLYTEYKSQATLDNVAANSSVNLIDPNSPTGSTWTINIANLSFSGFEAIINQATDDQTPQEDLRYGLIAIEDGSFGDVADAQQQGRDFPAFRDVKSGAELDANGNKLIFNEANDDTQYRVSAVVWDNYGNTSNFNIITVNTPILQITEFYINEIELILDVDEQAQLTVTIVGEGFTGDVIWQSLDPNVVEHLGDGVFRGVSNGQTGVRAINADLTTYTDTIPITVKNYVKKNDGEVADFTVGGNDFIDTEYAFQATIGSVSITNTIGVEVIDSLYSTAVITDSVEIAQTPIDLSQSNSKGKEYVLLFATSDNAQGKEYATSGIVNTSLLAVSNVDGVAVEQVTFQAVIDTMYSMNAEINSIQAVSEISTFFEVIPGQDNAEGFEYTGSIGDPDDHASEVYFDNFIFVVFQTQATINNVSSPFSLSLIDTVIDSLYSGASQVNGVQVANAFIDLFVDTEYSGQSSIDGIETSYSLELLNLFVDSQYLSKSEINNIVVGHIQIPIFVDTQYSSLASIDTVSVSSLVDVDGPISSSYDITVTETSPGVWDIEMGSQGVDDTTPQDQIGYGLIITSNSSDIATANDQGQNYGNYIQTKTGAELTTDNNIFTFVDAGSLNQSTEYLITVISWDEFNNTSQYNITSVVPQDL